MYINYLCKINKSICNDSEIRDKESLKIISNAINEANNSNEDIIINAMQVAALIKLYQPFYDGNHRTALIIFGNLITQKGYTFDYEKALTDMKEHKLNLPTLYREEDKVGKFDKWYEYIEKQNNQSL